MALLVSGGSPNPKTVEVILNDGTSLCSLQSSSELPDPGREYHTMDGGIICGGLETPRSCIKFETGNWNPYSTELKYDRVEHVSWNRLGDIQLMGSSIINVWGTTEVVSATDSVLSYNLQAGLRLSCSIQFPDQVIVTGGIYTSTRVSAYGPGGYVKDLPGLLIGRYSHGCTSYLNDDGELVYIVAGGRNDVEYLESAEFYKFGQPAWALLGDLPSRRAGLRGATLNNNVFMTGGVDSTGEVLDEILMLNKQTLMWQYVGQMKEKRFAHAVSTVKLDDFKPYCNLID